MGRTAVWRGAHAIRRALAASGAMVGAGIAFGLGTEALRVTRRRQVTDAYTGAVTLLGSADVLVRVGGVHTLGLLLADAPVAHDTVVRTLSALVRERVPALEEDAPDDDPAERPPGDVRAALTVLATRPERPEAERLDLSETRLAGANLTNARLTGANLFGIELGHADLSGANLDQAELGYADLRGTRLWKTRLAHADLTAARLDDADLADADLRAARISGASLRAALLQGARLHGATLSDADLTDAALDEASLDNAYLSRAQLHGATFDGTRLPGTSLLGTDLTDVDLSRTKGITEAQLADANVDATTRLPDDTAHT